MPLTRREQDVFFREQVLADQARQDLAGHDWPGLLRTATKLAALHKTICALPQTTSRYAGKARRTKRKVRQ